VQTVFMTNVALQYQLLGQEFQPVVAPAPGAFYFKKNFYEIGAWVCFCSPSPVTPTVIA
jgi:hypothetical protein